MERRPIDADSIVANTWWGNTIGNPSIKEHSAGIRKILGGLSMSEERILIYSQETNTGITGIIGNLDQQTAVLFTATEVNYDALISQGAEMTERYKDLQIRKVATSFKLLCERIRAS